MNNINPCTDKLTDLEYLEHMIPHHQVAIDMSNLLIPNTKNARLLHLCHQIIRVQEFEIFQMNSIKKSLITSVFSKDKNPNMKVNTTLSKYYPKLSKSKEGECNPLFFKPDEHSKHMNHMKINDKMYLEHMIPHHQVAVDMSKRLLLHTSNSYLINFCYELILNQENEIFYMNSLLKSKKLHNSNLLN